MPCPTTKLDAAAMEKSGLVILRTPLSVPCRRQLPFRGIPGSDMIMPIKQTRSTRNSTVEPIRRTRIPGPEIFRTRRAQAITHAKLISSARGQTMSLAKAPAQQDGEARFHRGSPKLNGRFFQSTLAFFLDHDGHVVRKADFTVWSAVSPVSQ